jgi:hypothetical protein
MVKKRGRRVDDSCLEAGPVRHHTLPASLVARIGNVARIFHEVDGRSAAEWARDFQRDRDPEKEVAVWEAMAAAYSMFAKERGLTLEARREALQLLLLRSMQAGPLPKDFLLKHLKPSDAVVLLAGFKTVASAEGWGFHSNSTTTARFHDSVADQTVHPSAPQANGEFTVRDEANALTALAFRNGFLEELHAGKHSPLLDDPACSRITDDEMRRLMIEASEKLARMLELKGNDPDQYEARLRDCHERYCRNWKRD